ncbi:MAG: hypothetical protein LH477_00140 [Nocardioides sp.]|nr:hypothetical protein [Nocardioides sp.]
MNTAGTPLAPRVPTLIDVVELACLAPSVHHTQPWAWRVVRSGLELYADRRRLLRSTDPAGHHLVVSCGAALHHSQVAALALGWQPTVQRLPEGPESDLLARIDLTAGHRTPEHMLDMDALPAEPIGAARRPGRCPRLASRSSPPPRSGGA